MVQKVIWSPESLKNLKEIQDYILKDSAFYAFHVINKIYLLAESIAAFPYSGRVVPEFENELVRERFYRKFRIIYRIKSEFIEIAAVRHSARLLQ